MFGEIGLGSIRRCLCSNCPSFPGMLTEVMRISMPGLYCALGQSRSRIERRGCICGDCRVQIENEMKGAYYCLEGSLPKLSVAAEPTGQPHGL